jgi:hypothetical protein
VDFATASLQNDVCITQGKCHKMKQFLDEKKLMKEQFFNIFCHNLHNISVLMNLKLVRAKSVL